MFKAKLDTSDKAGNKCFYFVNLETGAVSESLTYVQFEKQAHTLRTMGVHVDHSALRL